MIPGFASSSPRPSGRPPVRSAVPSLQPVNLSVASSREATMSTSSRRRSSISRRGRRFGLRSVSSTAPRFAISRHRVARVPYVFEPLGMFEPRLRKVFLKRALDATLYRGVARGAAAVAVASQREAEGVIASGIAAAKVRVRGNGFPEPFGIGTNGDLRSGLGIPASAQVILYVGRIAAGKGIEHLLDATRQLTAAHLVIAGPDDRHGTSKLVQLAQQDAATTGRIHMLPVTEEPPHDLYPQADVFVLASAGESFGMVAAEAAAAGTPVIVSDRCGIAGFFADGEALVVPYDQAAVVDAVRRVLTDAELRERLARGGVEAARRTSWDRVTDAQEGIYRAVTSRTAATKLSTEGS